MSKTCGDTARYNRIRIQRIKQRERARILRAEIDARKAQADPASVKPKA
jgi:hypothetical protein